MIENYINTVINGDCVEVMKELPEGSIDLIVTSPPYGVNIAYDVHDDDMEISEYLEFTRKWLTEAYKVLKVRLIDKRRVVEFSLYLKFIRL